MTTSLQLAQECLKDNEPNEEETTSQQTFDGLESFAQTIESGTMSLSYLMVYSDKYQTILKTLTFKFRFVFVSNAHLQACENSPPFMYTRKNASC